jgi:tetratricopeptide (TPR) repeat protein
MALTDIIRETNDLVKQATPTDGTPDEALLKVALQIYAAVPEPWPGTAHEVTGALSWRGSAHIDLGQFEEAIADYDRVIGLDPKDADAYGDRAFAKINLKRYEEAIVDLDKAIGLNPKNAVTYHNRSFAKFELKRWEEAIADLDKAIELDPKKNAVTYNNRGFSKLKLGRHEDAVTDLETSLQDEVTPSCALLGDAYRALNRNDDAEAQYQKALELLAVDASKIESDYRQAIRAERGLKALGKEVKTNYTAVALEKGWITAEEMKDL